MKISTVTHIIIKLKFFIQKYRYNIIFKLQLTRNHLIKILIEIISKANNEQEIYYSGSRSSRSLIGTNN
jgi:hypothetical protein